MMYCMITSIWNTEGWQIHRNRKQTGDANGRVQMEWEMTANGFGVSFSGNESVLELYSDVWI